MPTPPATKRRARSLATPLAGRAAMMRQYLEPARGRWWRHDLLWGTLRVLWPRWCTANEIGAVFAVVARRPDLVNCRSHEAIGGYKIRAQLSNWHSWGWVDRIGKRRHLFAGRRRLEDGRLVWLVSQAPGMRYRIRLDADDLL